LQAAGLADRADPLDPAVAVLGLCADLSARSAGLLVGSIPSTSQNVHSATYSSSRFEQEPRGLGVPAAGALLEQRLDGVAARVKLGFQPGQVMIVLQEGAVGGEHVAGLAQSTDRAARHSCA